MKIFKQDDSIIDIASKIVTSAGVIFGAWAYFHTIHPVFEKEIELQNLRSESKELALEVKKQNKNLTVLNESKKLLENNVASLKDERDELRSEIYQKEQTLKDIVESLKTARDAAILNKLQYYSDKLTSAYLLAVTSGKQGSFDALAYSKEILATHIPDKEDELDKLAYEYFEQYVTKHDGKEIRGDQAIEFSVSLFFDYKIYLIKKKSSLSYTVIE